MYAVVSIRAECVLSGLVDTLTGVEQHVEGGYVVKVAEALDWLFGIEYSKDDLRKLAT